MKKRANKRKICKVSEKYLDDLWSREVKKRAGYSCEYCGKTEGLNSHHIFTRSNRSTRWDIQNGIALCSSHHILNSKFSAHKASIEFIEWLRKYRGEEWYQELRKKARKVIRSDQVFRKIIKEQLK